MFYSLGFFCITADSKYIIKTLFDPELVTLRHILPRLHKYYIDNPATLLCKIVGLYEMQLHLGFTTKFIVLHNIFDHPQNQVHARFDLKGSWINRRGKDGLRLDSDMKEFIYLQDQYYENFVQQLKKDSDFLASCGIMDYSLLLGIHDKVPDSAAAYKEEDAKLKKKGTFGLMSRLDLESVMEQPPVNNMPKLEHEDVDIEDPSIPFHRRAQGGMANNDGTKIYYMGIIDMLQEYDTSKKLERFWKVFCCRNDRVRIVLWCALTFFFCINRRVLVWCHQQSMLNDSRLEYCNSLHVISNWT